LAAASASSAPQQGRRPPGPARPPRRRAGAGPRRQPQRSFSRLAGAASTTGCSSTRPPSPSAPTKSADPPSGGILAPNTYVDAVAVRPTIAAAASPSAPHLTCRAAARPDLTSPTSGSGGDFDRSGRPVRGCAPIGPSRGGPATTACPGRAPHVLVDCGGDAQHGGRASARHRLNGAVATPRRLLRWELRSCRPRQSGLDRLRRYDRRSSISGLPWRGASSQRRRRPAHPAAGLGGRRRERPREGVR
jgi:hypothetical protein